MAIAWAPGGSSSPGTFCVLALEETQAGIAISGSANLDFNCGLAANSSGPPDDEEKSAFVISGESTLQIPDLLASPEISLVGGYYKQSDSILEPLPTTGQDPFDDPLASLSTQYDTATAGACPDGEPALNTSTHFWPGTYCNGLDISGVNAFLEPGVYIIGGGAEPGLAINGSATVTGTDVTFLLMGSTGARVDGSSTVDLTAPMDWDWAGILIYQDPNAPVCGGMGETCNEFDGGTTSNLQWALYFPNQYLEFSGSADLSGSCLMIVARWIEFSGDAIIGNACEGTGVSLFDPVGGGVATAVLRLVH